MAVCLRYSSILALLESATSCRQCPSRLGRVHLQARKLASSQTAESQGGVFSGGTGKWVNVEVSSSAFVETEADLDEGS